jgi:hypothetical protein
MAVTEPHDQRAAGRVGGVRSPAGPTGDGLDLDRRLQAADPLAGGLSDDSAAVLVRRLAADVAGGGAPVVTSRRRTTLTLLAAALLLCLAAGSPVIAHRLSAWTGIHGSGIGEEDASEYLLSSAPDYRQAVESLRPSHIPLPPGYEWRKAVDRFTAWDSEPTMYSATGIKDIYAGFAACAWEAEWLAGRRASDAGRVRAATTMLAEARSWPDAGADKTGGARRQRDEIATAAANGDAVPLRQDVKVNCDPSWIRSGGR